MSRRYLIIGAGGVGASIAAQLHLANIETVLIARGAHLAALREHGLLHIRPDSAEHLRIPVAASPDEVKLAENDVLVVATKSPDTETVARTWAAQPVKLRDGGTGLAAEHLPVVTLQNGLANEPTTRRYFSHVIGAVIWIPATYLVPGEVVSPGSPVPAVVWLGRYPAGADADATEIGADLQRSGLAVQVVEDITRWKAHKLLGNLINALDALYPPSRRRDRALAALQQEARTVFAAAGIDVADLATESTVDLSGFKITPIPGKPRGGSSTWQSLARGGTPETDYLNGEIVLLGEIHGTPAPLNAAIQHRIRRALADGVAAGSLDDADLAATLPEDTEPRAAVLITAGELRDRLAEPNPPVLLDVRWALGDPHGAEHYRAGHLPGASYVDLDTELAGPHAPGGGRHPLPELSTLQANARRWGVTSQSSIVVYDNSGGLAAARAWWLLRWAGVPDVRILDGGLSAWTQSGYEQATGTAPEPKPGDVTLTGGQLPTLTADEAAALAQDGVLLDARAGERYRGETEPIDPRAGHIPGAVSAPTTGNLQPGTHLFQRADQLRERFAGLTGRRVGVYCGSGVTAAHEIAALAVAGIDAALYPGSWSAWSTDPARPAETGPGLALA